MQFPMLLMAALLIGDTGGSFARPQATAFVSPTGEIPRDDFKTWSLFLVCSPDWVAPERSADLAHLYHRFRSFGDAIGSDNLAVWFWKKRVPEQDPRLSENVDVARSAEFCKTLGRAPSQGPYIVVTTAYPDLKAFPAERAVFELGGLPPDAIAKLLNTLTDQLLLQGKVDAALAEARGETRAPVPAPPPSLWMRLLEGTRQSLIGVGCMVKLQIVTGLLNAELRACPGQ